MFSSSAEYCNYMALMKPGHDETKSSGTRQSGDRRQNERGCSQVTSSAEARRSHLQRDGILVRVLASTAYLMVHYFTIRSVQFLSGIL
jgi:hypothetical protein